ncbi:MAG: hypothetical protein HY288_04070 [Planctomycetia bacterium]|nr:hypothetical protein [Planctomycetia bacterium]
MCFFLNNKYSSAARLLARTNCTGQPAIVGSIFGVPERFTTLDPLRQYIEFRSRTGGRFGWRERFVLGGTKILVVAILQNCFEHIPHLPHRITPPTKKESPTSLYALAPTLSILLKYRYHFNRSRLVDALFAAILTFLVAAVRESITSDAVGELENPNQAGGKSTYHLKHSIIISAERMSISLDHFAP